MAVRKTILAAFVVLHGVSLCAQERPNVLWITAEDHGPQLGAYGDKYATTPVLDALAAQGMIYRYAWSTAPVCAPARTTLISGLYPPSTGSQHMRSMVRLPAAMKMYPQYLRQAGYYCTNNSKEDYNLEKPGEVWDESSNKAHWRHRKAGQPFFAIFNFTQSHESQIRTRPHQFVHDPAKVRVPAYHPDTPEVRLDWAQYYDNITTVDGLAGKVLQELEADGLGENTIVFYYADHGAGMPRSKRWPYNSGLQVPVIVYFPEKWRSLAPPEYRPGGESFRLIGFIDFAPTLLSLCGIEPPQYMQGRAFAGRYAAREPEFQFGFRGRMDERYDMVRSVRDERYIYIRNYMPHRIYGQFIDYMFQTPTTRVWKALFDQGRLDPYQETFWNEKRSEELYDLLEDPDEVNNRIEEPALRPVAARMRAALRDWHVKIRDVGFLPEGEIHSRAGDSTPYEMGHDDYRYPLRDVMRMAEAASSEHWQETAGRLREGFHDSDSAVRYWAAVGALARKEEGALAYHRELNEALADKSPYVRVAAAEVLGRYGLEPEARKALEVLLELASLGQNSVYVSMAALNAIDYMDARALPAKDRIAALPKEHDRVPDRMKTYVGRLIEKTLADLQ
jgi:uncharacterized sulfatase